MERGSETKFLKYLTFRAQNIFISWYKYKLVLESLMVTYNFCPDLYMQNRL